MEQGGLTRRYFGQEFVLETGANPDSFLTHVSDTAYVTIYRWGSVDIRGNLFNGLLGVINTRDNLAQTAADAISMMNCYMPTLLPVARQAFINLGFAIREVLIENVNSDNDDLLELGVQLAKRSAYLYIGQLIMAVYKEITNANYMQFMQKRSSALAAQLGLLFADDAYPLCVDLNHALHIRRVLGIHYEFKKTLLQTLRSGRALGGIESSLCNYVCMILQWYQMASITFIVDKIILADSPIITDHRVKDEFSRLSQAMVVVMEHGPPEYFRILAPTEVMGVVERNRFRTLVAVAQEIAIRRDDPAKQFRGATKNNLVDSLVRKHFEKLHVEYNLQNKRAFEILTQGIVQEVAPVRNRRRGNIVDIVDITDTIPQDVARGRRNEERAENVNAVRRPVRRV